jgi:hypothetical protein
MHVLGVLASRHLPHEKNEHFFQRWRDVEQQILLLRFAVFVVEDLLVYLTHFFQLGNVFDNKLELFVFEKGLHRQDEFAPDFVAD